ncbi:hypothetical protein [Calycomorphotria hydatis]|nr:hypothetical protein [Calycomorphotria hydatis]
MSIIGAIVGPALIYYINPNLLTKEPPIGHWVTKPEDLVIRKTSRHTFNRDEVAYSNTVFTPEHNTPLSYGSSLYPLGGWLLVTDETATWERLLSKLSTSDKSDFIYSSIWYAAYIVKTNEYQLNEGALEKWIQLARVHLASVTRAQILIVLAELKVKKDIRTELLSEATELYIDDYPRHFLSPAPPTTQEPPPNFVAPILPEEDDQPAPANNKENNGTPRNNDNLPHTEHLPKKAPNASGSIKSISDLNRGPTISDAFEDPYSPYTTATATTKVLEPLPPNTPKEPDFKTTTITSFISAIIAALISGAILNAWGEYWGSLLRNPFSRQPNRSTTAGPIGANDPGA